MIFSTINRFTKPLLSFQKKTETRSFFEWLNIVFNRVDHLRIKEFGPDRVCAEWLLKNGATVQWVGATKMLTDYNSLPTETTKSNLHILKVDASGSSISHYGFLHFRGCNFIREIILHDCGYIANDALKQLSFVKNSLEHLQVSSCGNITETGLAHLKDLSKLKSLELHDLPYVKNKVHVIDLLKTQLPNCKILSDFEEKKQASNG